MHRNVFVNFFYKLACKYPTPSNLSYLWNFGIFALVALIIQIITGIILVMHYTPHIDYSFYSVEHIMRDVNYGWLLRYAHANGASMFFIVVYAHIFRGMLYGSYLVAREALWCSGVLILLFMILTAFLGYILPWGQMSLWGATVITNLASTLPKVGEILVFWLWGGFSVANPTLTKFFSLHYIFPFIILIFVIGHLLLLHITGSSNPLGINYYVDKTPFAPYYIIKDTLSIHWFLIFYSVLIFFIPNYLGHPDNYIPANSDVTPEHIVPEWYFLPFYAILRSIPDKSLGVIALLLSIIFLFFLPFLHKSFLRSSFMKPIYRVILLLFFSIAILLGYIGSKPIEYPYLIIGQLLTLGYFSFFALVSIIDKLDFRLVRQCIQGNFTKELKKKISFIILAMPLISASDMLVNFSRISLILAIIYASVNLLSSFAFKIALFQKIKKNKFFIDLTSLMVLISRIFVHLSTKKANTISRCSGIFLANFIFIRAAVGSGLLPLGLNFFTFLIFSFYLVSMINTFFRVSVFFGHRMDSMEKSINLFRNPEDWNRVFKYGWRIGKPYLNQANVNKPFQQNSQNVDGLKRFGIYGAIAGTGVAAYAAYEIHETRIETRKTRIATEESVRIQKQVADAQERRIDISEREKGYMSQAHFEQKWNPFGEKRK